MHKRNIFFSERFCLQIVTIASVIFALYAVLAGVFTHSAALILDGVLYTIDFTVLVTTMHILRLIDLPTSEEFPYGYFKLEPLIITLQASMLIISCLFSILHSIKDLFHHTSFIRNYYWGLSYTLFTVLLNIFIYFYISAVNKRRPSDLLESQKIDCRYGLFLALGLFIGFVIANYLELSPKASIRELELYVDPLMTIFIVLVIIREPTLLFLKNFNDLLDRRPSKFISNSKIFPIVHSCAEKLDVPVQIKAFKLRKAGRAFFGLLEYSTSPQMTLAQISQLNAMIIDSLNMEFENLHIYFVPTVAN